MPAALALSLGVTVPALGVPAPQPDAEHYLDSIVDRSVDPRDDFFGFAVGQWLRDNPIPANERRWGVDRLVLLGGHQGALREAHRRDLRRLPSAPAHARLDE